MQKTLHLIAHMMRCALLRDDLDSDVDRLEFQMPRETKHPGRDNRLLVALVEIMESKGRPPFHRSGQAIEKA